MKASKMLIATLKETPNEAVISSHVLLLRAGMIRKLVAGVYNYLPLGLRVLSKVEAVIREEMDKSGALEIKMPVVQPAELWEESGLYRDVPRRGGMAQLDDGAHGTRCLLRIRCDLPRPGRNRRSEALFR